MNNIKTIVDIAQENCTCMKVTMELCTICNWRCRHCYIDNYGNFGLDLKTIKKILDTLRKMFVFEITFTGGEIFCRNDIMQIIEYARSRGFLVSILSNASLLTDSIIEDLSIIGIEAYECSIYSLDNETHDEFVQKKGALESMLKNIKKLKNKGIRVKLKHVITKIGYKETKKIKEYCNINGYEYLGTDFIFSKLNGDITPHLYEVDEKDFENIILESETNNGYSYIDDCDDSYICKDTRWALSIDSNGNIYPCNNFQIKIGNVLKDDLVSTWKENKILKMIQNTKYKDTDCKGCKLINRCYKCSGITLLETGDFRNKHLKDCKKAELRNKLFPSRRD